MKTLITFLGVALAVVGAQAQTSEPPLLFGPDAPKDITQPKLNSLPRGFYPPVAIRCHWEGTPVTELLIDADGRVVAAKITKSSGNAVLDQAALDAEKQLQWQPATRNGVPIAARWPMGLQFQLRDQRERERPVPANCPAPPLTGNNSQPN